MASRESVGNGQFPFYFHVASREASLCSGDVFLYSASIEETTEWKLVCVDFETDYQGSGGL